MSRRLWVAVVLAFFSACVVAATPVIKVNGITITDREFELTREALTAQVAGQDVAPELIARGALDQLIARVLLVEAAKEAGIQVPSEAVEAELQAQIAAMGGRDAFQTALAQAGLTESAVRRAQEERMVMAGYFETIIRPRAVVTEQSAREFWVANPEEFRHPEQTRLWMILLEAPEALTDEYRETVKQRAEALRTRISSGEPFAQVARESSEDPSREQDGLIGWVRLGLLLPELEEPVFALKKGEVSAVLPSRRGFHIFKAEDRRPAGVYPFEEIKDQLREILQGQRINEAMESEVIRRRGRATIEVLDESLRPLLQPPTAGDAPN